jgi:hypothetical protein
MFHPGKTPVRLSPYIVRSNFKLAATMSPRFMISFVLEAKMLELLYSVLSQKASVAVSAVAYVIIFENSSARNIFLEVV